tara:strand:+ start:40 stop:1248 length:1209 start_codon:yes stop_codon:yes gene_type:complete
MKNTHLEHLEDNILNDGSQGGKEAVAFLRSLGKMLDQGEADARVTVKWDGAPAVICGKNPENGQFFVGTKSVFNKTNPKIIYSENDVDDLYTRQLAEKLKASYRYLSTLSIPNVVQGDLLFTDDKYDANIGGDTCIAFQPNTIVYAVPKDSDIGQKIEVAKLGIVFHTQYSGRTMDALSASFGDINIKGTQDVFVTSSDFKNASGEANMTRSEKTTYANLVNKTEGSLKQASRFLDLMKTNNMNKFTLNIMFKTFFNRYIRQGKTLIGARNTARDFAKYFSDALDKEIATKKMKTTKDKYLELKNNGLKFISDNQQAIYMTVASYMNLQAAKNFMIRKLQKVNTFGTFLRTPDGYRVTAPEGFVAIRSGRALKLVDRLEFSRANFTADKNWDKGNPMPEPKI